MYESCYISWGALTRAFPSWGLNKRFIARRIILRARYSRSGHDRPFNLRGALVRFRERGSESERSRHYEGSLRTTLLYGLLCNQTILRTSPFGRHYGASPSLKFHRNSHAQTAIELRDWSYRRLGRKSLCRWDEWEKSSSIL